MLNELYQLSNILEKQGLLPQESTHRDVHKLAKCECLYISLNEDGMPVSLRLLDKEDTTKLWVHSKGNHNRFPAIKVQKPLLPEHISLAFNETIWNKADLKKKREILSELDYRIGNPKSNDIQIKPWTLDQMKPILECQDEPYLEGVRRLLIRFPRKEHTDLFYYALRQVIRDRIWNENERTIDFLKVLLVGNYDSKTSHYISGCSCYFDIWELSQVISAVADPETEKALIRTLLTTQDHQEEMTNSANQDIGISALSGTRTKLVRDKYPNPKFQVIGPAYLYSNNTGALPCLLRYRMEGTKAFPVGKEQVRKMNDALGFLMEDLRKGFTWKSFWGTSGKRPLLLLAWLEDNPKSEARLADALGDEGGTFVYEGICKKVLELLHLKLETDPDAPVHLQLFETLDTGRKQIVYSRIMNVGQVYKNIEEWIEAAKNIPPIVFSGDWKNEKGKKIHVIYPHCPGPGVINRLLRTQYRTQNSNKVGQIQDRRACLLTEEEIYRLVIPDTYGRRQDTKLIDVCMQEVLRTNEDLLLDAFRFQTVYEKKHPFSKEVVWRACSAVELLGILLYKKGIRKEQYMESKMFLLGRLMKLADYLHKNYCIIERNGETLSKYSQPIPRQLMGASVYQLALQKPEEALARLSEKMQIYLGWANANPDSQCGWILNLMEKTFEEIHMDGGKFPTNPTLSEKVELIIGYGCKLPYIKKKSDGDITDEAESQKEA